MAVELATAYISLNAETSKIPGQISSAVEQGGRQADSQGRGMGAKLASGLGSTLKFGALAAGAVAGAAISTALTQGMGRLVAIDDAKGKLAGLGHDAAGIATIMDSALASVKGTAFGLGDAATIAASAVAAGIKPGQELTKYLSLTGDAATIAGTSLEEMGSIFNKVQTSGTVFTDNLNQLSDRGIPIFQWLQDEYKVSAEELKDMVKEGKVDSATFKKVIEDNIGGAALESGKTLRGSFENMKAALGRVGEAGLKPFAKLAQDSFGGVGGFADKLAPKVEAMATKVATGISGMAAAFQSSGESIEGSGSWMERFGARLRTVTDGVQGVFSLLASGDFKGAKMTFGLDEDSKAVDVLLKIRDTAIGAYNILFKGDYTNPIWGGLEDSKAVDVLFRIREGAQSAFESVKSFFGSSSGEKLTATLSGAAAAGTAASDALGDVGSVSSPLADTFRKVADSVGGLGTSLFGLLGDSAVVVTAAVKTLGSAMGFLADNSDLVGVALGGVAVSMAAAQVVETGYQAARIANAIMMPAQIAAQLALVSALTAHTAALYANIGAQAPATALTLRARIAELASAAATRVRTAATVSSTSSLGAYAAAQRLAATQVGGLNGAARNAAASVATLAGSASGVGTAAMGGLRTAAGKVASFLGSGGGFMIGIVAAIGAVMAFKSSSDKMNDGLEASRTAASRYADTMIEFRSSLDEAFNNSGGAVDSGVKSVVSNQLETVDAELDAAAERIPGKWDKIVASVKDNPFAALGATSLPWADTSSQDGARQLEEQGNAARRTQEALDSLKLSDRDLATGVSGSASQWSDLKNQLAGTGESGQVLIDKYQQIRDEVIKSQSASSQMKDALAGIADGSVGAADGVNSLTSAMSRLRGDQMSVQDAQQQVNDTLRSFAEAAQTAGASVILASGEIDTGTAAGSRLYDSMKGVQGAFDQAGASAAQSAVQQGLSAADTAAAIESAGQRVRDSFIDQAVAAGIPLAEAIKLADQYRLFPGEIKTNVGLTGASEADKLLDDIANKKRIARLSVEVAEGTTSFGSAFSEAFPPVTPRADGGIDNLPGQATIAPGRGEGIFQWAERETGGEAFIPLAPSKRGRSLSIVGEVAKRFGFGLTKFANGGINDALNAGRNVEGNTYVWGGTGPTGFDCSGFVGWLQQIAMGIVGSTKRLYTTYSLIGGALAGLQPGLGPSGTQFQVGVSDEHMAATIAGHAAESGGAHGTSGIDGGRASAQDSQFPHKFHLPNELVAGFTEGGATEGIASSYSTSGTSSGSKATWSDKNELDLDSAKVSITQAMEARAKVETAFAEGKKTQADLDQANLRVAKAEQRVVDLQTKKDNAAAGLEEGPPPQAPGLERAFTEGETATIDAQLALESANERRNEIYADEESTDLEKLKADAALFEAQESLKTAGVSPESASGGAGGSGSSLPGAKIAEGMRELAQEYTGIFFDAISETFGLEKLGFIPSGDKVAEKLFSIGQGGEKSAGSAAESSLSSVPSSFPQSDIDKQGPVTPGAPGWLDGVTSLIRDGEFKGAAATFGLEEDNAAIKATLGLRSLLKDGDFTSNLREGVGVEEDNPGVVAALGARSILGGDFTGNTRDAFGVEEDDPRVVAALAAQQFMSKGDFNQNTRQTLGMEEDNPSVVAALALRSIGGGDYTRNFGDAFGAPEDSPIVDWLFHFRDKVPVFDEGGALQPGLNVVDNKTGGLEYLANVTKLMPALKKPELATAQAGPVDQSVHVTAHGYSPREVINTSNRLTARRSRGAMLTGGYGR